MNIDVIFARRSIRAFTTLPVSDEDIHLLLEAGMAAPSARDLKPWHFVVVKDRSILNELMRAHPYASALESAPAAIVVCGDTTISPDFWIQDCSAATENILVAAAGIGLGAVWLGCHPREERVKPIRSILSVPQKIGILCIIPIGYPAEKKEPRTRYDEKRVHHDKW